LRLALGLIWNELAPYSSRPKPVEAIGRATALAGNDPLLGIDLVALPDVWRMLALCEVGFGIDAGLEARSKAQQTGPSLCAIEVLIARARYARALSDGDLQKAFQTGIAALSASKVTMEFRAIGQSRAGVAELQEKSVQMLRTEGWGEMVDGIILDALFWSALRGELSTDTLEQIRSTYESTFGQDKNVEEILAAASGTKALTSETSAALRLAHYLAPTSDVKGKPDARLERDLLLVSNAAHSGARDVLEPLVVGELVNGWSRVVAEEAFALRMPLLHGPDIETAIQEMRSSGLKGAARLIVRRQMI
jgi:hypothetical protein